MERNETRKLYTAAYHEMRCYAKIGFKPRELLAVVRCPEDLAAQHSLVARNTPFKGTLRRRDKRLVLRQKVSAMQGIFAALARYVRLVEKKSMFFDEVGRAQFYRTGYVTELSGNVLLFEDGKFAQYLNFNSKWRNLNWVVLKHD